MITPIRPLISLSNHLARRLSLAGGCLLMVACSFGHASPVESDSRRDQHGSFAPHSIAGMDINLQIENAVSTLSSGFPTQGVVVKHYQGNGSWTGQGTGGPSQQTSRGTYQYHRTGSNTAVENAVETSLNNASYSTTYTFDSAKSGKWVQNLNNGQIVFSGRFTMVASDTPAAQHLAPATNAGLHVALIIKSGVSASVPAGAFPSKGLVLQTYSADGTLVFQGFGPGTLNSRGTYTYKKVSANTAVEETVQTSDFFTLPYTMVYTFTTSTSGTWYQNFAGGLIRFSGTFDTFPK